MYVTQRFTQTGDRRCNMRKYILMFLAFLLVLIPTSTAMAGVISGEIELEQDHPILTDGEITETEWRAGEDPRYDGIRDPGSTPPKVEEPDNPSFLDRAFDWLDGLMEAAGDLIGDVYEATVDTLGNIGRELQQIGIDILEAAANILSGIADWWNGLSTEIQHLILTIIAVVAAVAVAIAVAAIVAALVAGFALTGGVIAAIIAGAVILGGLYYIAQGGTEDFSFLGVFTSALAGGLFGAFAASSAGASTFWALIRALGTNNFKAGLAVALSQGKWTGALYLAGTWLKASALPLVVYWVSVLADIGLTGELPSGREVFFESLMIILTTPLGGPVFERAKTLFQAKNIFAGLGWGFVGINVGGISSFILASIGEGQGTFLDFLAGSITTGLFIYPDLNLDKFIVNEGLSRYSLGVEIIYEKFKGIFGDGVSDLITGNNSGGETKFYHPHVGGSLDLSTIQPNSSPTNINIDPSVNIDTGININLDSNIDMQTNLDSENLQKILDNSNWNGEGNHMSDEEVEAIRKYLLDLNAK